MSSSSTPSQPLPSTNPPNLPSSLLASQQASSSSATPSDQTPVPPSSTSQPPRSSSTINISTVSNSSTTRTPVLPQQPPTFPSPDVFDFIPQTHDLLAQLLPSSPSSTTSSAAHVNGGHPTTTSTNGSSATNGVSSAASGVGGKPKLDPKSLDAEASRIRLKISRARGVIADLPDITRTVREQEEEIRELERKVVRQREVLGAVRGLKAVREAVRKASGGGGGGGGGGGVGREGDMEVVIKVEDDGEGMVIS